MENQVFIFTQFDFCFLGEQKYLIKDEALHVGDVTSDFNSAQLANSGPLLSHREDFPGGARGGHGGV